MIFSSNLLVSFIFVLWLAGGWNPGGDWLVASAKAGFAMKPCAIDADRITIAHLIDSGHNPIAKEFIFAKLINHIGQASDLLGDLINMDVRGSGAGF
jgi:hypothetical protein